MKVAYLTAGAGGMYCGSCMRDNTLAAALRRQGRDITLIPVYSPIRTDEPNVSADRVFYGGINVYLQQKSAIFRFMPAFMQRFLDQPGLLRYAMKKAGAAPPDLVGPLTVSMLQGEVGAQRQELSKLIAALKELQPDVVHLPNAMFVGLAREIKRQLGVAVVCALTGEDIFLESLSQPYQSQTRELIRERGRDVDGYLCVTQHYANYAREQLGLDPHRTHIVPLGIRIEEDETRENSNATEYKPFTIGYLARICRAKGLHLLCEAFALLHDEEDSDCRLVIAGYLGESDRDYFDSMQIYLAHRGLTPYVDYLGEVDRAHKLRMLRSIDVLSVPTVYREAKGLYVLEAMSQGVPVVQPRHGSFPELIEATGGGLLFEPNNARALARSLAELMDDPEKRRTLGQRGRDAVRKDFTDEIMAERAWQVFERYAQTGTKRT